MDRKLIKYSEAFKRHVVSELESGRFRSHEEAREFYGIGGSSTVSRWVRTYGKEHLNWKVVRVETPDERNEVRRLKSRIRDLEKALADAKVKEVLSQAYFELACEEFGGSDTEGFKKKVVAMQSREDGSSGKPRRK